MNEDFGYPAHLGDKGREFWRFSVTLYREPGVPQACLLFQDRYGVDVNLLLFCLWRAAIGVGIDVAGSVQAIAATASWRDEVVRPIRVIRRRLKALAQADRALDFVYQSAKQLELEAEQAEHAKLAELDISEHGDCDLETAARAYCTALGLRLDEEAELALTTIVHAIS